MPAHHGGVFLNHYFFSQIWRWLKPRSNIDLIVGVLYNVYPAFFQMFLLLVLQPLGLEDYSSLLHGTVTRYKSESFLTSRLGLSVKILCSCRLRSSWLDLTSSVSQVFIALSTPPGTRSTVCLRVVSEKIQILPRKWLPHSGQLYLQLNQ